jgi:heparin/heparan-sulfate lyase
MSFSNSTSYNELVKEAQAKASSFDNSVFGENFGDIFKSPFAHPPVYPEKGKHPRVMVSDHNIDTVKRNLQKPENKSAYDSYLSYTEKEMTGEYAGSTFELLTHIEAKAFRYLITGEELYGYQAIYNIKNAILTAEHIEIDPYRAYGLTMYVAACVYDWCYDLLTDTDKVHIVRGAINLLGKRMEIGCPPSKVGAIAHHTVECQILRSYLSLAIAVYDEHPDIYEYVAGRLYNDIVPAQNFMLATEKHWEGAYYAPFRYCNLIDAQLLMLAMTGGKTEMFDSKNLHTVGNAFMDFTLPGLTYDKIHVFELGDVAATTFEDYFSASFFAGNLFSDSSLKGFGFECYNDKTDFGALMNNTYVSPVRYLIINDPDLAPTDPFKGRELVRIAKYPTSTIFARSAWCDKDAVAVYMTMPEFYSASHSHAEAGSFQIYYKGMLASDSGYYTSHGTGHHSAYTRQTISSNSILIYNPDLRERGTWNKGAVNEHPYCGGQSLVQDITRIVCPYTVESAKTCAAMDQVTLLGKCAKVDDAKLRYAYIAGDMTKAYDEESVDEVTRHMLSVMTNREDVPMVFATFDRITAKDASYKKTVLLHSMTKPEVTPDGFTVITNKKDGNCGKLVATTLLTDMTATVLGDADGSEYDYLGVSHKPECYNENDPDYRIDFCPKEARKTDLILSVMYVTDADNIAPLIKPLDISNSTLAGALLLDTALFFAKEKEPLTKATFDLPGGDDVLCLVAGVSDGCWQITHNGTPVAKVESKAGDGIISFRAGKGEITLDLISTNT